MPKLSVRDASDVIGLAAILIDHQGGAAVPNGSTRSPLLQQECGPGRQHRSRGPSSSDCLRVLLYGVVHIAPRQRLAGLLLHLLQHLLARVRRLRVSVRRQSWVGAFVLVQALGVLILFLSRLHYVLGRLVCELVLQLVRRQLHLLVLRGNILVGVQIQDAHIGHGGRRLPSARRVGLGGCRAGSSARSRRRNPAPAQEQLLETGNLRAVHQRHIGFKLLHSRGQHVDVVRLEPSLPRHRRHGCAAAPEGADGLAERGED
mmetsp:Transcript_95380/g.273515  ORF Transcript_95380/g.273515 Transcript_95380/m.273515 type:complete len:260 (-) Transcript_95380:15-794(-)